MSTGRPTKYTRKVIDTILALLRKGNTRAHASAGAGITYTTFAEWANTHPDFSESVICAEADAISSRVAILDDATRAAFDIGDYATAGRLAIEYLKRKDRVNWAERIESDVTSGGKPIEPGITAESFLAALKAERERAKIDGDPTDG